MATSIHPSLSCLLPFYTIPIFPLLNLFHLDILPEAICCCLQTYTVNDVLLVMCYQLSLSLVLIKASYGYIYAIWPEAI